MGEGKQMEVWLNSFILDLTERKGLSEATLSSYRRDLESFLSFLHDRGIKELEQVSRTTLALYFSFMKNQGKAPSTLTRASVSLRSFFKYLLREHLVTHDPFIHLEAPKTKRKIPEPLAVEDVNLLLDQPDIKTVLGLRDKAMLELMYATGVRVSELLALNLRDIDLNLRFVRIGDGSRHERIIPFAAVTSDWLERYLQEARPTFVDTSGSEVLFPSRLGGQMTRQSLWKTIKKYGQAAGIKAEIMPHTLRSSFAVHLLERGADLKTVQELMGHTDITSTQAYLNRSSQNIKAVYEQFHPRAHSGGS